MSYLYEEEKHWLFTELGVRALMAMRERAEACLSYSGAVLQTELHRGVSAPDTWKLLALADYLVEIGFFRQINKGAAGQDRVFVRPPR